ncbi:MAG: YdcF family protein [Rhodocyclaceae bacterium]|nr:YdcF family protein [Rhodocyclaceae bacterium]
MPFDPDLILFWAKKLAALAILPPLGPLLLIAAGLWRGARGRGLAWSGLAAAWFLSTPATVGWMLSGLEATRPVTDEALASAEAIVILAGGQRRYAPEFGGSTVNAYSLERVRYGARLARETGLPVMVSGGTAREETAEAIWMRDALVTDFGVTPRWIEAGSLDTSDNAEFSARLLRDDGIQVIALVTHAAHMPRAASAFRDAGLGVVEAPTAWQGNPAGGPFDPKDLLPTPRAALSGWYAAHEWLGRLVHRLARVF